MSFAISEVLSRLPAWAPVRPPMQENEWQRSASKVRPAFQGRDRTAGHEGCVRLVSALRDEAMVEVHGPEEKVQLVPQA